MQIDHAIDEFLTGHFSTNRRSIKTKIAYRTDLAQFQVHCGAGAAIELISVESLERWALTLATNGYSPLSVRRKFATIRVFFGYWVRKGGITSSPLWKIRMDLGREVRLPRCLSATNMKCLVERAWARIAPEQPGIQVPCDPSFLSRRDLAIIEVLFATGMRVGELVTLNLSDWSDEDESFIVKGKGLRQRLAILPDKRSSMAVRDYMARRMPLCLTHSALFINAYGERLAAQGVGRMLAKIADEARITERVTPHMIRHTVATLLLRLGADIRVVQEVLGHTSITTTQRYTHITKEHLRSTLGLHHPSHHLNIDTKRCF